MTKAEIKDAKLKSKPVTIFVIALLLITSMMIPFYAAIEISRHESRIENDISQFNLIMKGQSDTLFVRLKDLSAFVASGAEELIAQKLEQASRQSKYMSHLGFLKSDDIRNIRTLIGENIFKDITGEEFGSVLGKLLETQGLTLAVSPAVYPETFQDTSPDRLVLMQAMKQPDSQTAYNITYAVFDIKSAINDKSSILSDTHPISASFISNNNKINYEFEYPNLFIEKILTPRKFSSVIPITSNLPVKIVFKEKFNQIGILIISTIGLLTLAAISGILFFYYMRESFRTQNTLLEAIAKAESASQAKSDFLANMSHEIRTPLNGVLGMAEILSKTSTNEGQRRYIDQIKSSGGILLSVLNDVLDIAKLESGQLSINPTRTKLPVLLGEIAGFYAPNALQKSISLQFFLDPALPEFVEVDPTRLRQVLGNLLSNAIKFTHHGEVLLKITPGSPSEQGMQTFEFAVRDTGIGIPEESLPKLFDRFSQAEESTTREYGGTGLGLSICKEICEIMGGSITVASHPGVGTTFTFSLALPFEEKVASAQNPGIKIAVIGKDATLNQTLKAYLSHAGIIYEFFAPNEEAHLAVLEMHRTRGGFDVVIIDEGESIHYARAVNAAIQEHPDRNAIRCLILGNQQANKRYLEFDSAIIKPFAPGDFYKMILRLCRGELLGADVPSSTGTIQEETGTKPYEGFKALLVDDNNVNLMFGDEILTDMGFAVTRQTNGARALENVRTEPFDVIFMDCQMPVMDGYEASTKIKALITDGEIAPTPIVALTANALKGDKEKCLAAGMDKFLTKPLQLSELNMVLEEIIVTDGTGNRKTPSIEVRSEESSPAVFDTRNPESVLTQEQDEEALDQRLEEVAMQSESVSKPNDKREQQVTGSAEGKIPLIDSEAFKTTRNSMKKFDTLISFYQNDTAEYLDTIKQALTAGDAETAVMPAHTIKSSSRVIGALGLAALAENFELRARQHGMAQHKELEQLRMHMERIFGLTKQRIIELTQDGDQSGAA
jgi:signal transduction histidine kinase/CheY-like chemotaxis protein